MPLFVKSEAALKERRALGTSFGRSDKVHNPERTADIVYFLHIPKCGGTSVAHLWRQTYPGCVIQPRLKVKSDIKHCRLDDVADDYDLSFSCVRNPITWYESWWRYLLSPKVTDRTETLDQAGKPNFDTWIGEGVWHPLREIAPCHDRDFAKFIDNVIDHAPGFVSQMYRTYLGSDSERPLVDRVLKIETIDSDYKSLCNDFGFAYPNVSKRENVSSRENVANWQPNQLEKMKQLENDAFKRFGYS